MLVCEWNMVIIIIIIMVLFFIMCIFFYIMLYLLYFCEICKKLVMFYKINVIVLCLLFVSFFIDLFIYVWRVLKYWRVLSGCFNVLKKNLIFRFRINLNVGLFFFRKSKINNNSFLFYGWVLWFREKFFVGG